MTDAKTQVRDFWNDASCGEDLLLNDSSRDGYCEQARQRYDLEPYIEPFADFSAASGQRTLEIGVGLGADHQRFAEAGAKLSGIDLTPRAIEHTRRRLALFGLDSDLQVADAEALPFPNASFDRIYSWGVLHHSPNTPKAIDEALRVLRTGGRASVMIYHRHALVGYMLWIRYALLRGKPWLGLDEIYARYLESPGTKAYTVEQAKTLFSGFSEVKIETVLTHGDLLESAAGQSHRGMLLSIARTIWPRWILRRFFKRHGLFMLIQATK
jgi:ubiquinone/menaquinone biosynthesis C-methylase UbiE